MGDAREPGEEGNDLPVVCRYPGGQGDEPADEYRDTGKGLDVAELQDRLYERSGYNLLVLCVCTRELCPG